MREHPLERSGQTFGRYTILRQLGAGGMGEVLLARQSGLPGVERPVVLKKVLPHLANDPEFIRRFLDETRVASLLTHGNIVQVYEVGEVDGQYFMAMEYVDGPDLREVLATLKAAGRRMPEHLALYVLVEVAKGLAYAHERTGPDGAPLGIVHRDVSPANLLLSYDGQVKLTDFGVAKAAARLSLSLPGTLHGKVYYMSPEQVSGGECDQRSDAFSLGVVAWEMLAGRRPFEGDSDVAVIDAVRRCEPEPLSKVAPWVAPSLAAIVERSLRKDPAARYPDLHEFQAALTSYMLEAHTLVSARSLADFLSSLRPDRPEQPAGPAPSLEEAAASLARDAATREGGEAQRTRTVAPPSPPPARDGQAAAPRGHLPWVVALTVAFAAVAGMWAAGQRSEPVVIPPPPALDAPVASVTPDPGPAAAVADVPADPVVLAATADVASDTPAGGDDEEPARPRRSVALRSDPPGAEVFAGDRRLGTAPLDVPIPPRGTIRVEVRLDRHEARTLTLGQDSPATVTATLRRLPTGHVHFRFFPADAEVYVDDRRIETQGNVVRLELAAGKHVLRVQAGDRRKVARFEVKATETTELGTIEPPARPEPDEGT